MEPSVLTAIQYELGDTKNFTPMRDKNSQVGVMLVSLSKCGHCKKIMVYPPRSQGHDFSTFPVWMGNAFDVQVKRAGWVLAAIKGDTTTQDEGRIRVICVGCAAAGHASFTCKLCKEKRSSDLEQAGYGDWDDRDSVCKPCYETVPAKEWEETLDEISKEHRYDYC